jgi:uroporphyrinogen decarboxylase
MDLLAKGSVFVIASGIAAYYMSKRSQGMKEKNKPKSFVRTALKDMPPMKNDLLLRAARGEVVERIPVWMMRQAGRYLPEYHVVRATADFFTICRTPKLACKITLQPLERYPKLDALIIFSDILVIPQAMGMNCDIVKGKGPVFDDPLKKPEDIQKLNLAPDVNETLGYVFDALNVTRVAADGRVPLIGFTGAPWTLLSYMIEGGSSRTLHNAKKWLYSYPEKCKTLLQAIAEIAVKYLVGQVKAGAQLLQLFESWGGELSTEMYNEFSLPYLKYIATETKKALKKLNLSVPMTIFAKGQNHSLEALSKADFDVISIDWVIDPSKARELTGNRVTLQGNFDPGCMYAPEKIMKANVKKMCAGFGKQRYIANLGWGMQPYMTPDMAGNFIDAVYEASDSM